MHWYRSTGEKREHGCSNTADAADAVCLHVINIYLKMNPDDVFEQISQSEVDDIQRHVDDRGVRGLPDFILHKQNQWKHVPLAIALVGEAAVGKSTFINSIRGLTADDNGAAPVGTGDITKEPTQFPHPYNDQLVFWDLPGIGTPRFPKDKSYLGRVGYSRYDFFLLLSDNRFSENDIWLAREIESQGKNYFFVRTKIDEAMESAEHTDRDFNVASVIHRIKQNCEENFVAGQLRSRQVYCIDSYDKEKWDFSSLMNDILVSLPELKRDAMVLSLSPLTKGVIRRKAEALRSRTLKAALLSGAGGAGASLVPIPLVGGTTNVLLDIAILVHEVHFYLKQMGLDDESLTELSKKTGTRLDYYKEALKDGSILVSKRQGIKVALLTMIKSEAAEAAATKATVEVARIIPFIGAIIGGLSSFGSSYYLLHKIIKELEADALTVIDAAIQTTSTAID